ncbi:DUF2164 domain-containing protein [uncultured Abyssibacter sp.]|uniref:DUF2164 domain-containing protein n=1 Tax=uncultured Abyssibacter sp. TaxID=2320202 RepID=UPI0032B174B4
MSKIEFSTEQKAEIVKQIKLYFQEELSQDIGGFDAEFLLDFFAEEIGSHFYNQGLADALAAMDDRLDGIRDAIYALEKPTGAR